MEKIWLKKKTNNKKVYVGKYVNPAGHISYFLIPRFCTYCGHEGLIDEEGRDTDWIPNRCPACGLHQCDEIRPYIDRDEWEEIPNDRLKD